MKKLFNWLIDLIGYLLYAVFVVVIFGGIIGSIYVYLNNWKGYLSGESFNKAKTKCINLLYKRDILLETLTKKEKRQLIRSAKRCNLFGCSLTTKQTKEKLEKSKVRLDWGMTRLILDYDNRSIYLPKFADIYSNIVA
jgi:hypothetical protein